MGTVLHLSEPAVDLVLYGNKGNLISNYLVQQMQNITPAFNDLTQRVYQTLQSSYEFINDRLTQYGLLNQLTNAGVQALDNYYQALTSFTQLQEANYTMQRWVMCHPEVRQLYLDQNIDGYSGTYQNVFGKGVGEDDYNYRLLMDGVLTSTDDQWQIKYYSEDLLPGDKPLDHYEKVRVLSTHDTIDHLLATCKFDFTCQSSDPVKINRE